MQNEENRKKITIIYSNNTKLILPLFKGHFYKYLQMHFSE